MSWWDDYGPKSAEDWAKLAALGPAGYGALGYLQKSASDPSKTAAAGAEQAAGGFTQLGQEARGVGEQQWGQAMQGLGQQQHAMAPSQALWQQLYGNQQPGVFEQAWGAQGQRLLDPTASQGAYDDLQRTLGSGSMVGKTATGSLNRLEDPNSQLSIARRENQFYGPSSSETWQREQGDEWKRQGVGESFAPEAKFALGSAGAGENWWEKNQGRFDGATNQQQVFDLKARELTGPARSSKALEDLMREQESAEAARSRYAGAASSAGKDTYTGQAAPEIQKYIRGASDVSDFSGRQLAGLEKEGMFEDWARQSLSGQNPAIDRLRTQGIDKINQEMARRGHFRSGGAQEAIGNYNAELDAKLFEQMSGLAKGGQEAMLARVGAGQSLAGASGAQKLAQAGGLQALAGSRAQEAQGQAGLDIQGMRAAGDETAQARRLRLDASGQADRSDLDRLAALNQMAAGADASSLAKLTAGGDAASRAQAAEGARVSGLAGILSQGQQDQMRRLEGGQAAAQGADAEQRQRQIANMQFAGQEDQGMLARQLGISNISQAVDQDTMARLGIRMNAAGQVDQQGLARLNAYLQTAEGAQGAQRARQSDAFQSMFGMNKNDADMIARAYETGGARQLQATLAGMGYSADAINAITNAAAIRAQGQAASAEVPYRVAGLGIEAGKASAGAG